MILRGLEIVLMCCAAAAAMGKGAPENGPDTSKTKLQLELQFDSTAQIRAVVTNNSAVSVKLFTNCLRSPVRLDIRKAKGTDTLPYLDKRAIMRFPSNQIEEYSFASIAAGESRKLTEAHFTKHDGKWHLMWCYYTFKDVPPGTYVVTAHFTASYDRYYDSDARQWKPVEEAWKGELQLQPLKIVLP